MALILVVEDDQFFREAICDVLKKKNYQTLQAPDGRAARSIMTLQKMDLVISDIQMPGFTGIELLEWSKKEAPVPFIIMTGFSQILETQSAFDLGAKGFVAKPFKNQDLLSAIDGILGIKEKSFPIVEEQIEYCKVSIDEFRSRPQVEFDVFIRLNDSKVIKIAHSGGEIPTEKIEHYKSKGVRHLHIKKQDFGKLVKFNISVAKTMVDRPEITEAKKLNFIKYAGEVLLEKVFVAGADKESLTEARSFIDLSLRSLSKSEEHVNLLDLLNTHSNHLYAHCLGVSFYAVMIAKKMGIESNLVLFKLSLAGIYHDIGKKEVDVEILEKPRHLLSQKERQMIESHVIRGFEILSAMPAISDEVTQMIYEHHEDQTGQGYPLAKKRLQLHPLSKILQVANIFVNLTVTNKTEALGASAAITQMKMIYGERMDAEVVSALKSIFI